MKRMGSPLLWQFTWWTAETCEHWTVQHDLYLNCYLIILGTVLLLLQKTYHPSILICLQLIVCCWWGPFTLSTYCIPGLPHLLFPGMVPVMHSFTSSFPCCLIECPKNASFLFTIRPSNSFLKLSSFRMPVCSSFRPTDSQHRSVEPHFSAHDSVLISFLQGPSFCSVWHYNPY